MPAHRPMEERFWSKVDKDGPVPTGHPEYEGLGPCWLFNRDGDASLVFSFADRTAGSKRILAHRYSWTLHYGQIPDGLVVRHRCDNGHLHCVNPNHLVLGTQKQNVHDRFMRRQVERHAITYEMAAALIVAYEQYDVPVKLLAAMTCARQAEVEHMLFNKGRVGVPPTAARRRQRGLSDAEVEIARGLAASDATVNTIAGQLGRNWTTVRAALARAGVVVTVRTKSGPVTAAEVERARAMLADGRTLNSVAIELGRTWAVLGRALAAAGVTVRTKSYRLSTAG